MSSLRHNRAGFTPYHGASPTGHGRGTGHRDFERWAPNACAVQPRSSATRPRHGGAGLTMVEVLIASILVASAAFWVENSLFFETPTVKILRSVLGKMKSLTSFSFGFTLFLIFLR